MKKKASGLLINFAGYPYTLSSLMPDNGLANLASSLIANGYTVKIMDFATVDSISDFIPPYFSKMLNAFWEQSQKKRRLAVADHAKIFIFNFLQALYFAKTIAKCTNTIFEVIDKNAPSFVGFKLWNGDGYAGTIKIAQKIKKKYPAIKIFGGGPQVDWFEEEILKRSPFFDVLICGEGESEIVKLAEFSVGNFPIEKINNAIYLKNGKIFKNEIKAINDLGTLGFPNYDRNIYPAMNNNQKMKIFVLDESRGCPNQCAFCNHSKKSGLKLRTKKVERIIREILFFQSRYGASFFRFAGSNTPWKLLEELSEEIISRKIKIKFSFFAHAHGATDEILKKIKQAGGVAFFLGIESGSQPILGKLGKKLNLDDVRKTLGFAKKNSVKTVGSIIHPAPFETIEDTNNTVAFLSEVKPDSVPVLFPVLFKGTQWWENPETYNIKLPDKKKYLEKLMCFKVKNLYPPRFWKPHLPYFVNDENYLNFVNKTEAFINKIRTKVPMIQFGDDNFLMADIIGMAPPDFQKLMLRHCFSGNKIELGRIVAKINYNSTNGA